MSKDKHVAGTTPRADEVHLRRLTVDEALLKLDKYLNDAFIVGFYQVRVIHGKGTGTLRQVVGRQLTKHPLVKSHRPGGYGEGGAGVTIVELESK
ncbi:Smr/MutS family protein [Chloroflexota bacterium]